MTQDAPLCRECYAAIPWVNGRVLADTLAVARFDGPMMALLHRLKYEHRPDLARPLGAFLGQVLVERGPFDLIMPVPLARQRLRQRGYNQSQLLAHALQKHLGVPMLAQGCHRVRETPPQVGLLRSQRLINVRGAFQVPRTAHVANRHILLIDDVMTTGATLQSCAAALRRAGAASVTCAVVAVA